MDYLVQPFHLFISILGFCTANWKNKMKRSLVKPVTTKQVQPLHLDTQEDDQDNKIHPKTKDPCLQSSVPLETRETDQTYFTKDVDDSHIKPSSVLVTPTTHDKERQLESGGLIGVSNGTVLQSKYHETMKSASGVGGLASFWHRGRSKLNPPPAPCHDGARTDAGVENRKAKEDIVSQLQVNLDLIFFWIFLLTWIAVTIGFSIAIFK